MLGLVGDGVGGMCGAFVFFAAPDGVVEYWALGVLQSTCLFHFTCGEKKEVSGVCHRSYLQAQTLVESR